MPRGGGGEQSWQIRPCPFQNQPVTLKPGQHPPGHVLKI